MRQKEQQEHNSLQLVSASSNQKNTTKHKEIKLAEKESKGKAVQNKQDAYKNLESHGKAQRLKIASPISSFLSPFWQA